MLPEKFYPEIGALVLEARRARGLSRQDVASATGFYGNAILRIEAGEHRLKLHEAITLDNYLRFGLFNFMKKWGAELAKPPEEVEIGGRKYRLVG